MNLRFFVCFSLVFFNVMLKTEISFEEQKKLIEYQEKLRLENERKLQQEFLKEEARLKLESEQKLQEELLKKKIDSIHELANAREAAKLDSQIKSLDSQKQNELNKKVADQEKRRLQQIETAKIEGEIEILQSSKRAELKKIENERLIKDRKDRTDAIRKADTYHVEQQEEFVKQEVYRAADRTQSVWMPLIAKVSFKGALILTASAMPGVLVSYTYQYFISKLKDPRIIIETSIGWWPYEYAKWIFGFKPSKAAERLQDMILATHIKERIKEIIAFQKAHIKAREGFDNILLTGNPGTGKTMFAKAIAAELGMDYIVLTGSSFFQENAGVKALDQIFGRMTKGRKVVIFIDEIDSITASRVGKNSDSDAYRLLNQLLNYTSTPNKNFILIGATNYPELIDKAFYRRFQHVVEMPLPAHAERAEFLNFAKDKYLMTKDKKYNERVDAVLTDAMIRDLAVKTDGLSYAELQTIIDHIKSAARLSDNGLTKAIIYKAMEQVKAKESSFKKQFLK